MCIDPPASEGQGRQVSCHRARGRQRRAHTSNRTDGPCSGQTWSVNEGQEGVRAAVWAELTLLGCVRSCPMRYRGGYGR